jgi:hypothetical protein
MSGGRSGHGTIAVGWSWITTPPDRLEPEDFDIEISPDFDREEMQAALASAYGEPRIDWSKQSVVVGFVTVMFGAMAWGVRGLSEAKSESREELRDTFE